MKSIALNSSVAAVDVVRLSGQCLAILRRLGEGPATNVELSKLSLKYTSRISEIKQAGHDVRAVREKGGVWRYSLIPPSAQLALFGR